MEDLYFLGYKAIITWDGRRSSLPATTVAAVSILADLVGRAVSFAGNTLVDICRKQKFIKFATFHHLLSGSGLAEVLPIVVKLFANQRIHNMLLIDSWVRVQGPENKVNVTSVLTPLVSTPLRYD